MKPLNFNAKTLAILATVLVVIPLPAPSTSAAMTIRNRRGRVVGTGSSITLAELISRQRSIQIGDKIFENWRDFSSVVTGGAAPADPALITVVAVGEGTCDPGPGVRFETTQFVVTGIAQSQQTSVSYDVRTVSGDAVIAGIELTLGAFQAVIAGRIDVTETVRDQAQNIIGTLAVHVTSVGVSPPGATDQQLLAAPQPAVAVTKTIRVSNGGAEDIGAASLGEVTQNYSQLCGGEPSIQVTKQIACVPCAPGVGCQNLPSDDYSDSAIGVRSDTASPVFCYSITVTNTGSEALQNIEVLDNSGLDLSGCFPPGFGLAEGGSSNCLVAVSLDADTTNTVTVTATGAITRLSVTNSATATAIVVQATIDCPADVTVQCAAQVPAPVPVTATLNCGGVITISSSDQVVEGSCPNNFTVLRTYTARDDCENSVSCVQTITVDDDTPPLLNGLPNDQTVQCLSDLPPPANVTANDNCDGLVTPAFEETQSNPGSSCNNVITRVWIATDSCGNVTAANRRFTVNDTTPPTFDNCTSGTTELGCNPPAASFNCDPNVTASDNCGPATVTCVAGDIISDGCRRTRTLTYTATDGCGNTATCVRTLTWTRDVDPPTFDNCTSGTTELGCNPPAASFNCDPGITASDNCGPATVTCVAGDIISDGCRRTRTLTYTATDGCGNTATCVRTLTWTRDVDPPTFDNCTSGTTELGCNPPAASFNCDPGVTASDNCGPATVTCVAGDIISDGCRRTRTLTYTATDGCANTATCVRTLTWTRDVTPPVISQCAPDITICASAGVPPPDTSLVISTDDCGPVIISVMPDVVTGDCPRIITRTYVATDGCGNQAACNQTITVNCEPACSLSPPSPLPACGSTGNTLSGPAGFVSYSWSANGSSAGWMITGGADTQTITYSAGPAGVGVFTLTVTDANGCSGTCQVSFGCVGAPTGIGCRVTGGSNRQPGTSQVSTMPRPRAVFTSHAGQVGAPFGVSTPFTPASACIRGEWQHNRHLTRNSLAGSFHAAGNGTVQQFDSIMCACLPCPGGATGGQIGVLCNQNDRVCGPEPRRAPANKICFSGVGDYTFTRGQKTVKAVFRVDIEDRSEPGGRSGRLPPDRYRIRLWVLDASTGRVFDPDSPQGMALRLAVACTDPLTEAVDRSAGPPDIDDGGAMIQGNHQIHPQTGASCR
jgi:hypothetical protein